MISILSLQQLETSETQSGPIAAHSNGSSTCVGISCTSDGCTGTTTTALM